MTRRSALYGVELKKAAKKMTDWLADNDERIGRRGKPVKSNITDNDSAKLVSSHGVIQGYNGVVDPGAKIFDFVVPAADSGFNSDASTRVAAKTQGQDHRPQADLDGPEVLPGGQAHEEQLPQPEEQQGLHRPPHIAKYVPAQPRLYYSRRMGAVEPVFANTRATVARHAGGSNPLPKGLFSTGSTTASPAPSQERSDEKASGECDTLCGDR
jgi:hypothetical protein